MICFKDINGYEGLYSINALGEVWSHRTNKYLKGCVNSGGYYLVTLCKDTSRTNTSIHSMVAAAFIPNTENKPCINHKDGNKLNNNVTNLEWCTYSENTRHAFATGLCDNGREVSRETCRKLGKKYGAIQGAVYGSKNGKKYLSKPVLQLDKTTGKIIASWNSTMCVQRELGINNSTISACCLNKPHYNTAGGYKWCYRDDYKSPTGKKILIPVYKKKGGATV